MVKYQQCESCGIYDITGAITCMAKQICPSCAAKLFNVPEADVRHSLMQKYAGKGTVKNKRR